MGISKQIKKLMQQHKISRLQLSNETGIPYTTLTQIINERTKNPQVKALESIADYFNVSLDYIMGHSLYALIEKRLTELNMTTEDLNKLMDFPTGMVESLDTFPPDPRDYEPGGLIERLARTLKMDPAILEAAYSRQEPPVYNGPVLSPKEAFNQAQIDFEKEEFDAPDWATNKDKRDLEKYLAEMGPLFYKGIEFSEEDKAKMLGVAESIFWDAKQKNKEAYKKSRQKKKDNEE